MNTKYRKTKTTISFIQYHFVFCPRYRRKIFIHSEIEQRFKHLIKEVCTQLDFELITLDSGDDYAYVHLSVPPQFSPADVMKHLKGATNRTLRHEFPLLGNMPTLWTRSYFVSTEPSLSAQVIHEYVETQKTRYD